MTDWHSPCERRIDGDRVTELIPSREWLSGRVAGNRGPDVNPLVTHPQGFYPPALPRHKARDHLHDRNREHALYDVRAMMLIEPTNDLAREQEQSSLASPPHPCLCVMLMAAHAETLRGCSAWRPLTVRM